MASVNYTAAVDEIRGKVGGSVFQGMAQTTSLRAKAAHRVSASQAALHSRHIFQQVSQVWGNMSGPTKQTWHNAAPTYPHYNKFGKATKINGYQLFIRLNTLLLTIGESIVTTASNYAQATNYSFDPGDWNLTTSHFDCKSTNAMPANYRCIVSLSKTYYDPSNLLFPKYKFYVSFTPPGNSYINIWRNPLPLFGLNPDPSMVFYLSAVYIDVNTGHTVQDFLGQISFVT
jgi:hypothetical protein